MKEVRASSSDQLLPLGCTRPHQPGMFFMTNGKVSCWDVENGEWCIVDPSVAWLERVGARQHAPRVGCENVRATLAVDNPDDTAHLPLAHSFGAQASESSGAQALFVVGGWAEEGTGRVQDGATAGEAPADEPDGREVPVAGALGNNTTTVSSSARRPPFVLPHVIRRLLGLRRGSSTAPVAYTLPPNPPSEVEVVEEVEVVVSTPPSPPVVLSGPAVALAEAHMRRLDRAQRASRASTHERAMAAAGLAEHRRRKGLLELAAQRSPLAERALRQKGQNLTGVAVASAGSTGSLSPRGLVRGRSRAAIRRSKRVGPVVAASEPLGSSISSRPVKAMEGASRREAASSPTLLSPSERVSVDQRRRVERQREQDERVELWRRVAGRAEARHRR